MGSIQGYLDPRFSSLRGLFQCFLDSGEELGASICVNIDGENVVDIWGGSIDADQDSPWEKNTVSNVFSTTKPISALICLVLSSRKQLDLDEAVCTYWPEFGGNGKGAITIRQIISHTSGISGWEVPVTIDELCTNFEGSATRLAEQEPWWEPGAASGYHSLTMGFLVGQLVRRVTGNTAKDFLASELAGPLGAKVSDRLTR